MNKIFLSLLMFVGMFFSVACGESNEKGEEQQEKAEKEIVQVSDKSVEKSETHCPFLSTNASV